MNSKNFRIVFVSFLLAVAQGCSSVPLTPSQTAEQFWDAILVDDLEMAGRLATPESAAEPQSMRGELQGITVSVGKVQMASDQATVETVLEKAQPNIVEKTGFTTYLKREHGNWRVDLLQTKQSLISAREKRGMDKLVDDLQKLGKDITGQLNEARKNWEKMEPEIKQDLKELGESVQKDVEGAIEKFGPEIQRKLEGLSESLDEALKELEKGVPPEKPSDTEEKSEGRMI
ncbi:MAG: hypothetical protein L0Z73_16155 [Gammaproteobacteria bacterium]|nr:hypothetical protein [Gammaproteobacteria bacterium]